MLCFRRLLVSFVLLYSSLLHALPGDLDTSFGGTGLVTTALLGSNSSSQWRSVIQQSDGKLVVAGSTFNGSNTDFAVVRYNSDGSLDTTFNGTGKVITAIGTGNDVGKSLIQQADGKLVVAGYSKNGSNSEYAVVRYNTDGSLDTSLDTDGIVTTAIDIGSDEAYSVIQQADGKLVVAGNRGLVRYESDGTLDTTFDDDGMLSTGIASNEAVRSVIQQADGKLVGTLSSGVSFGLIRYETNGALDTTFSGDGKAFAAFGINSQFAYSVIQQSDGKLVLAGYAYSGTYCDFALVRFNTNGSVDTTFSGDGQLTTGVGGGNDFAYSVIQQADGKLFVAGYNANGTNTDFALARYNTNGTLDTTFSGDGLLTTSIGSGLDIASAVIQQSDGKLVVAGYTSTAAKEFVVARYQSGQVDTDADGLLDWIDTDNDNDGVPNSTDDLQLDASESVDTDGDQTGNNADPDDDNDSFLDASDNCPLTSNASQTDTDTDALGDACDSDDDNDGLSDASDNCPLFGNPSQTDTDSDAQGDDCDTDDDNDSWSDANESACGTSSVSNASVPLDTDGDLNCDAIDTDDDNDGWSDANESACGTSSVSNVSTPTDTDSDLSCDAVDSDDDNDSVADGVDNCPLTGNTLQTNTDGDSLGDSCDSDDDNDGVLDGADNCPLLSNASQADLDYDSKGDACDTDDDGDWVADASDNCPLISNNNQLDWDNDGLGNACDADDDNDAVADPEDNCRAAANDTQADSDGNGLGDACEVSRNGDIAKSLQGSSVATGDVNNDGLADLVIGTPLADRKTLVGNKTVVLKDVGNITIISGADGSTLGNFYGKVPGEQFGRAVAVYPDVDADGISELIVGNPLADPVKSCHYSMTPQLCKDAGNVSLYSGADGSLMWSIADGASKNERLGAAVAVSSVGEIAVGSPGYDLSTYMEDGKYYKLPGAGLVNVYSDADNDPYDFGEDYQMISDQIQAKAYYGSAVGWVDDHLVVGSPGFDALSTTKQVDAGLIEFYDLFSADAVVSYAGTAKGDKLGAGVSSFNQDMNGDGETDWVVGAPGIDVIDKVTGKKLKDAGTVLMYSGTAVGAPVAQWQGAAAGDNLGTALAAGADITGDEQNDLVVGVPKADVSVTVNGKPKILKDAGTVRIFSGADL